MMETVTSGDKASPHTPLLILPGYLGSIPTAGNEFGFAFNRGFPASGLTVAEVYQQLATYLESKGYVLGQDLFFVPYDYRVDLALPDSQRDGTLSNVTATELTDGAIKTQVDYLGEFLKQLVTDNPKIKDVNILAHSNGNNVIRAYLQSRGYGKNFKGSDGPGRLPTVGTVVQIAPPSEGAALAWNPWNDNISGISSFGAQASTLVNDLSLLYDIIIHKGSGAEITGPGGPITRKTLLDNSGEPSPTRFIRQYFSSLETLNPTYNFLYDSLGFLTNINSDRSSANRFLLDLNAKSSPGRNPWALLPKRVSVTYGVTLNTNTQDKTKYGPGGQTMSVATGSKLIPTTKGQQWYEQLTPADSGDSVVPLISLQSTYQGDPRITMKPWGNGKPTKKLQFTRTTGPVDHISGILTNPDVQAWTWKQLAHSADHDQPQTQRQALRGKPAPRGDQLTGLRYSSQPIDGQVNDFGHGGIQSTLKAETDDRSGATWFRPINTDIGPWMGESCSADLLADPIAMAGTPIQCTQGQRLMNDGFS